MQGSHIQVNVVFFAFLAALITVISIYISRRYVPQKLNSAYRKSIAVLAAAVETRDFGAEGYAKKVAKLSIELADMVGVTDRELERIEYAALLMEIGKAQVPQSLLNKSGSLTPDEWRIVRNHSRRGAEMVAEIPHLANISSDILHHHEYWNGDGYPFGLSGNDIPVASRILLITGDYVAMTSERPYRDRALKPHEAAYQVNIGSGTKYDPYISQAFLKMKGYSFGNVPAAKTEVSSPLSYDSKGFGY